MELILSTGEQLTQAQLHRVRLCRQLDPMLGRLQPGTMQLQLQGSPRLDEACALGAQAMLLWQDQVMATQQLVELRSRDGLQSLGCKSDLEFLQGRFYGGMYENAQTDSLVIALLGERDYTIDLGVDRQVNGYLDVCTRGQALEQLALAQGGCMALDPMGGFWLVDLQGECTTIDRDRVLSRPVLSCLPGYTRVELVAHGYTPAQNWEYLFQGKEFPDQEQLYLYPHPVYRAVLAQGIVVDQGVNHIRFQPTDIDSLHVQPYLHTTAYHSCQLSEDSRHSRVLSVRNNGLITGQNVQTLLQRLEQRAALSHRLQVRLLVEDQDLGQRVRLETQWGLFEGYIVKMDSTFTPKSHVAEVTIQGYFPQQ